MTNQNAAETNEPKQAEKNPSQKPTQENKAATDKGNGSPTSDVKKNKQNEPNSGTDAENKDVPAGAFDEDAKGDIDESKENAA